MIRPPASRTLVAMLAVPLGAAAQSPPVAEIEFRSEGSTVQGRFFEAGIDPIATLLLLPGAGFDPDDVLELGSLLSAQDVNVVTFTPRGTRGSEGVLTVANAVGDVGAALAWLRGDAGKGLLVDPERVAVGGHSLGGGIAMAYAARDSTVRHVISIAGNDLGEYARRLRADSASVAGLRGRLSASASPEGFARLDPDALIQEILDGEAVYGHLENAPHLAERSVLLVGGWDDSTAPIETVLLPFYRALKKHPESDVTILAYSDSHSFGRSRPDMASDIRGWLLDRFRQ